MKTYSQMLRGQTTRTGSKQNTQSLDRKLLEQPLSLNCNALCSLECFKMFATFLVKPFTLIY